MIDRPRISVIPSRLDLLLQTVTFLLLVLLVAFSAWLYITSPQIIPAHFDSTGKVNRYDNKLIIFILPFIGVLLFFGLKWIGSRPHLHNYPQNVTSENAPDMHRASSRLIRYMNLGCILLFCFLEYQFYVGIRDQFFRLNIAVFSLIMMLSIGLPIFLAARISQKKPTKEGK